MACAPCILFIDELDGISNRSTLPSQHATYWTQVVNALLEHLAGVEDRDGVVVLGASNHPDRIDPAVRRSGRLDRHIEIPMPDLPALEQILRYHLRGDLTDVDLRGFTMSLVGQSGADLEALVRRARGKARRSGLSLTIDVLVEASANGEVAVGEAFRRQVAVHEAGHVIAARTFGHPVTCMAMTREGGIAMMRTQFDGRTTLSEVENLILVALAGRAAEEVVYGAGSRSGGGESDLAKATEFALMLETRMGGGIYGPLHIGKAETSTLLMMPEIRHAVAQRLIDSQARAVALVRDNLAAVNALTEAILIEGYLGSDAIDDVIAQARVRKSTIRPKPIHAGGTHVA
jgi:ATP-dependent Zn protease